ncbi:hypothetical protein A0H81_02908 [Grifola frondosa]|uniref:Uncharacterized protein n=1 Tax=Grifola frondosa TaxID=5627 RepID=A0A1C7MNJ2_GRIFR|nr:hypothetical protein A0H81_02908 [Grifola frondosa]
MTGPGLTNGPGPVMTGLETAVLPQSSDDCSLSPVLLNLKWSGPSPSLQSQLCRIKDRTGPDPATLGDREIRDGLNHSSFQQSREDLEIEGGKLYAEWPSFNGPELRQINRVKNIQYYVFLYALPPLKNGIDIEFVATPYLFRRCSRTNVRMLKAWTLPEADCGVGFSPGPGPVTIATHGRYAPHTAGLSQTELSGLIGDVTVKVLAELQGLKRMAKIAGDALSALRPSSRGPVADEKAGSPAVASEGSPSGMGEAEISPQSVVISTDLYATEDEGVVDHSPLQSPEAGPAPRSSPFPSYNDYCDSSHPRRPGLTESQLEQYFASGFLIQPEVNTAPNDVVMADPLVVAPPWMSQGGDCDGQFHDPGQGPPVSSPLETVPSVVDSADIVMADPPVKASPVDMAVKRTPNTSRPANPQILHPVQADAGMDEDARVPITDTAALPISPLVASDEPIGAETSPGPDSDIEIVEAPSGKGKERAIDVDVEAIIVDADLGRSSSEPEMVEDVIEEVQKQEAKGQEEEDAKVPGGCLSSGDEKEDKKADAIVYPPDKELRVSFPLRMSEITCNQCKNAKRPDAEGFPRVASPRPPTPGTDGGAGSRESKGQKLPHPDPNSEARLRRGLYTLWMKTDISKGQRSGEPGQASSVRAESMGATAGRESREPSVAAEVQMPSPILHVKTPPGVGEMTTNNPRPKPRKVPPPGE